MVAHVAELLHMSEWLSGIMQRLAMHLPLRIQSWKPQIKDSDLLLPLKQRFNLLEILLDKHLGLSSAIMDCC